VQACVTVTKSSGYNFIYFLIHSVLSELLSFADFYKLPSGVGGKGCKCTSKKFDLSKFLAKSLEILSNSLEILAKSLKIWAKSGKMAPNVVWFQKMAPNLVRKNIKTFFWRSHQKNRQDRCRRSFASKFAQKLFRQTWEILSKIFRTAKYLLTPAAIDLPFASEWFRHATTFGWWLKHLLPAVCIQHSSQQTFLCLTLFLLNLMWWKEERPRKVKKRVLHEYFVCSAQ